MNNDEQDPSPSVPIGYELLLKGFAVLALLAVPIIFLGGVWLMFQKHSAAEGQAIRILVPVALIGSIIVAWKRMRSMRRGPNGKPDKDYGRPMLAVLLVVTITPCRAGAR